jgi:SNF2 family DNA or RNA helicase
MTTRPPDLVPRSLASQMERWAEAAVSWRPWAYQETALRLMLENPVFGLLLDPGLGKSAVTLAALKVLFKKRLARRALIVAPLRVAYATWPEELRAWRDFQDLGMAMLHGGDKEQVLRSLEPGHRVVVTNYETLPWLCGNPQLLKTLAADTLVFDELSRMKESHTVRFRALRPHLVKFTRRYGLTGSPVPNSYMDLFGEMYVLDRGAALGQYVTHYRNRYFFPTGFQMREWQLVPGMEKEINKAIAPITLRLDASDHLKLPKVMPDDVRWVELPPAARKEYDAIEETMMSTLFTAPLVSSAAARSKCAQIANGAVYTDPPLASSDAPEDWRRQRRWKSVHDAKVQALAELVQELQGQQMLVAIDFRHDVDSIRKELGAKVPCINGSTTRGEAAQFIEEWNAGVLQVLMVHPASAGHGLNLQKSHARHVCFFGIPDNFDYADQLWRRVWRQGNQAAFVLKHFIAARATVDAAKLRNLKVKGKTQQQFLDAMRAYAEERGYVVRGKRA